MRLKDIIKGYFNKRKKKKLKMREFWEPNKTQGCTKQHIVKCRTGFIEEKNLTKQEAAEDSWYLISGLPGKKQGKENRWFLL